MLRKRLCGYCCVVALVILSTSLSFAVTVNVNLAGGTLTYTEMTTPGQCQSGTYTEYAFSNFSYKDQNGTAWPGSSGGGAFFQNNGASCAPSGEQPPGGMLVVQVSGSAIYFYACPGTVCPASVSGYVNPKYIIMGVTYAPPGPSSNVDYTKSTLVGSTLSVGGSFGSGWTNSIKVTGGFTIGGWLKGSASGSWSTAYSQETDYSDTLTVNKQTSASDTVSGPSNAFSVPNHDYDIIWLWLNPVTLFNVYPSSGTVEWNGYGFSTLDQPAMDIYPVFVGWLNGDIKMTPSQSAPLQRAWAGGENWPSGQGPGLTAIDFQNIEQADPYWQCTPKPSACPTSVDPNRFTLVTADQDFVYQQAPVGGQPIKQGYTETYTDTTMANQSYKQMWSQTYGFETDLSLLQTTFSATLNQSWTLTTSYSYSKQITNTTSSTAALSITGPTCTVLNNKCNPVYNGPTQWDLYQDVLYGTFYLNPVH